jgi:hypothetical protein
MSWVFVAAGLAAGADWRRLILLALVLAFPAPAIAALGVHWWRQRLPVSMRGAGFCDAVSSEMRAGASFRFAVTTAARSVDADVVSDLCRTGAPMATVAAAARLEFPEIGDELGSLLARSEGRGVSPASLFDEIGTLALAQAEVAREVATASAPAKATGAVLLLAPLAAIISTAGRGGFDLYLAQPTQRVAASLGALLVTIGLGATILILRRAR